MDSSSSAIVAALPDSSPLAFLKACKLKPSDDVKKTVSKVVSFILRQGHDVPGVNFDEEKSVLMTQLYDICTKVSQVESYDSLIAILQESNETKTRYRIHEKDGVLLIKAIHKYDTLPGTSVKISSVKDTKWQPSGWTRKNRKDNRQFEVIRSQHFDQVIVRDAQDLGSTEIGRLGPGDIVTLIGEPISIDDGIVRMNVGFNGSSGPMTGWVTQDARKAEGPQFLRELFPENEERHPEEEERRWKGWGGEWGDTRPPRNMAQRPPEGPRRAYSDYYYDDKGGKDAQKDGKDGNPGQRDGKDDQRKGKAKGKKGRGKKGKETKEKGEGKEKN